jgi:hypothetical protein
MNHFWRDIPGYFTFPEFYEWVATNASPYWHGVEVGCYCGQSAAFLAVELLKWRTIGPQLQRLDLVDCEMTKHDTERHLAPLRESDIIGRLRECDSVFGASRYIDGTLDFVFIDADHQYASVRRDIDAWLPKVKPGGIIAGHDHCPDFTGVIQAASETFPRYEVWRGMRGPGWGDQRMVDTGQYYSVWSVRV